MCLCNNNMANLIIDRTSDCSRSKRLSFTNLRYSPVNLEQLESCYEAVELWKFPLLRWSAFIGEFWCMEVTDTDVSPLSSRGVQLKHLRQRIQVMLMLVAMQHDSSGLPCYLAV